MDMLKKAGLAGLVLSAGVLSFGSIRPFDYQNSLSFKTKSRTDTSPYKYFYFPSALENPPKSETKQNPGIKQNSGIYILKEEGISILCHYNWNSENKSLDLANFPFHGFKTSVRDPTGGLGDENIEVSLFDEEAKRDCQRIYQDFVRKKVERGYVMTSAGKEIRLSIPSEHFTLCINDLEGDGYIDEVMVFFDEWLVQRLNSAYEELKRK